MLVGPGYPWRSAGMWPGRLRHGVVHQWATSRVIQQVRRSHCKGVVVSPAGTAARGPARTGRGCQPIPTWLQVPPWRREGASDDRLRPGQANARGPRVGAAQNAVETVRQMLADEPDLTGIEVLETLQARTDGARCRGATLGPDAGSARRVVKRGGAVDRELPGASAPAPAVLPVVAGRDAGPIRRVSLGVEGTATDSVPLGSPLAPRGTRRRPRHHPPEAEGGLHRAAVRPWRASFRPANRAWWSARPRLPMERSISTGASLLEAPRPALAEGLRVTTQTPPRSRRGPPPQAARRRPWDPRQRG
jgi:hypothetical protein